MHLSDSLPTFLTRQQLQASAWDACVAASPQRLIYGYSWYLDTVLPAPDWKWIGLVLPDNQDGYRAVMPVPLRRKQIAGLVRWVVYQPFFCQFLSVFCSDDAIDQASFLEAVRQRFRYGSKVNLSLSNDQLITGSQFDLVHPLATHVLDLSVGYDALFNRYSRDRRLNLQRGQAANWTIIDSTDIQPLLTLFRENHAGTIRGGVADWAYAILEQVVNELHKRDLMLLRYAVRQDRIEAGALFVRGGNRIIYLFNAASETGRKRNARTTLIDQVIREYAGQPMVFDFESPDKPAIASFYRSFGAIEEPFYCLRWNRLTALERALVRVRRLFV